MKFNLQCLMIVLQLSLCAISLSSFGQQTTSSYIFFNENRASTSGRNWVIRQNNTHEGDLQFGFLPSNLGGLPNFTTTPSDAKLTITGAGNVGIGTSNPDTKLTVKGYVHAEEVRIDLSVPAPDYVFSENYPLMSLAELQTYLTANKHLPEIPAGSDLEKNGIRVAEMNMLLLKKVEELTLYLLEMERANKEMKERLEKLETLLKK